MKGQGLFWEQSKLHRINKEKWVCKTCCNFNQVRLQCTKCWAPIFSWEGIQEWNFLLDSQTLCCHTVRQLYIFRMMRNLERLNLWTQYPPKVHPFMRLGYTQLGWGRGRASTYQNINNFFNTIYFWCGFVVIYWIVKILKLNLTKE